jgi:hypothetical protein
VQLQSKVTSEIAAALSKVVTAVQLQSKVTAALSGLHDIDGGVYRG